MSPRAAWRLESLGFENVIDYVPWKSAWFEENQPREGRAAEETWLGDVADSSVPTCHPSDRIGDIRDRIRSAGWETCVVINDAGIVLGLLRKAALDASAEATAESVMHLGPKTFRPDVTLAELVQFMRDHNITTNSLVATLDGKLVGVISRNDAEATLAHEGSEQ